MKKWQELEFQYGELLRDSDAEERKGLYKYAYDVVYELKSEELPVEPSKRSHHTSVGLVDFFIGQCSKEDKILEIGCGRGYLVWKLSYHVKEVIGLDVSSVVIDESKELIRDNNVSNVKFYNQSATSNLIDLLGKNQFDKIISIDVYEHIHKDDVDVLLKNIYSLLKSDGKFFVFTPNKDTGPHDVTSQIYTESKDALGFHINETTPEKLSEKLRSVGFNDISSFADDPQENIYFVVSK